MNSDLRLALDGSKALPPNLPGLTPPVPFIPPDP